MRRYVRDVPSGRASSHDRSRREGSFGELGENGAVAQRTAAVDETLLKCEDRRGQRARALDRLELDEDDLAILDSRALDESGEMRFGTHVVAAIDGDVEQAQKIFPQYLEKGTILAAHARAEGRILREPADGLHRGPAQHLGGRHAVHRARDVQPVYLVRAVDQLNAGVDGRERGVRATMPERRAEEAGKVGVVGVEEADELAAREP